MWFLIFEEKKAIKKTGEFLMAFDFYKMFEDYFTGVKLYVKSLKLTLIS